MHQQTDPVLAIVMALCDNRDTVAVKINWTSYQPRTQCLEMNTLYEFRLGDQGLRCNTSTNGDGTVSVVLWSKVDDVCSRQKIWESNLPQSFCKVLDKKFDVFINRYPLFRAVYLAACSHPEKIIRAPGTTQDVFCMNLDDGYIHGINKIDGSTGQINLYYEKQSVRVNPVHINMILKECYFLSQVGHNGILMPPSHLGRIR